MRSLSLYTNYFFLTKLVLLTSAQRACLSSWGKVPSATRRRGLACTTYFFLTKLVLLTSAQRACLSSWGEVPSATRRRGLACTTYFFLTKLVLLTSAQRACLSSWGEVPSATRRRGLAYAILLSTIRNVAVTKPLSHLSVTAPLTRGAKQVLIFFSKSCYLCVLFHYTLTTSSLLN